MIDSRLSRIAEHPKIIAFTIIGILFLVLFHKMIPIFFFAFSVAIICEPVYLKLQKYLQKHSVGANYLSEIILLLFPIGATLLTLMIIGFPLLYLKNNLHTITTMLEKAYHVIMASQLSAYVPLNIVKEIEHNSFSYMAGQLSKPISYIPNILGSTLLFYLCVFMMIKYFREIKRDILAIIPTGWKKITAQIYKKTFELFNAFYIVHFLVALFVFFISIIFFAICGIKDILLVSLLTALLQLIPFIGAASMVIILTIISYITHDYFMLAKTILLGFPLLVLLPEMFLRPWLMGKKTKISAPILMIGILVGIMNLGPIGLITGPWILMLATELFVLLRERYGISSL